MLRAPVLVLALVPAVAAAAPVHGTLVLAPENRHVDVKPLAYWRLDNGRLPIAPKAHAMSEAVVVLEPEKTVEAKATPAAVEIRGVALEPRCAVGTVGSTFSFVNHDRVSRTLYLQDGEGYMPREAIAPEATRAVKFGIPGEYTVRDADYPHANATVVVVSTPYFAHVDDTGGFKLDVPEGKYRLRAWVPSAGGWSTALPIQVGPRPIDVQLPYVPEKAAPAAEARVGAP